MSVSPLAAELNSVLEKECPAVHGMLSPLGRRLYMPKGIISQSAEAKKHAHRFNATIGIATEKGGPMHLASVARLFEMDAAEVFPYAPVAGKPELRQAWRDKQLEENPRQRDKRCSLPLVTSALTHGTLVAADLFIGPEDTILVPAHFWGNYRLTFEIRNGGVIETYPLLEGNTTFNRKGFRAKLDEIAGSREKVVIVLNFPNNPTGFTPTPADAEDLAKAIVDAADRGLKQVVICDDAYFGLFYDEDCLDESIFGFLANAHPNVLAVKLDGSTKELFSWGFRVGFITYAAGGDGDLDKVHEVLEKKTMGAIRGGISNSPLPTQSAVLRALRSDGIAAERRQKREILKARALKTKEIVYLDKYKDAWTPYPFNSGYFMCVKIHDVDAEKLRVHLLEKHGVGVIASGGPDIRVAFSCLEVEQVSEVFDALYQAWSELREM